MEMSRVHHVGYLVKNMEKAILAFKRLGMDVYKESYFDEDRLANICFLKQSDTYIHTYIELVCPTRDSELYPMLKQYKNVPYHVCFIVDDIEKEISSLKKDGFLLIKEKQRALAIGENATVVFLLHRAIGMVELVELK